MCSLKQEIGAVTKEKKKEEEEKEEEREKKEEEEKEEEDEVGEWVGGGRQGEGGKSNEFPRLPPNLTGTGRSSLRDL